jgi:hypothetical protein
MAREFAQHTIDHELVFSVGLIAFHTLDHDDDDDDDDDDEALGEAVVFQGHSYHEFCYWCFMAPLLYFVTVSSFCLTRQRPGAGIHII